MNRKPYKRYSREFKVEALRLAKVGNKPATQVARELGIRVNQLEQLAAEETPGVPSKRGRPADGELERLRHEDAKLKEENDIFKKTGYLLHEGIQVKYQFVDANRGEYAVRRLCETLKISSSGYYAACGRPTSARSQRSNILKELIERIHVASRATYGAPRVHAELLHQGEICCKNTVARLMRNAGIVPKTVRRFRATTDSRRTKASPNLLNRVFTAARPNECWLTDVTFIPTRAGWLYLAAILDLHSRAIVGWSMHERLDGKQVMDALGMAMERRDVAPSVPHSDQGSLGAIRVMHYVSRMQPGLPPRFHAR